MNTMIPTERVYINTLSAGDFILMDADTLYVVEDRKSVPGCTRVDYRVAGTEQVYYFTGPGMMTVRKVCGDIYN